MTALSKLFDGMDFEVSDEMTPEYRCDCSRERLERVIISLGKEELSDIIENDGEAELVCSFCSRRYHFDKEELTALLEAASKTDGSEE
jgi:molecular chaperone Hsp33